MKPPRRLLATVCLFLLAAGPALADPLDGPQRACVEGVNEGAAGLVAAQMREGLGCLARAAKGSEPDAQACLFADGRGKVGKARTRLTSRAAERCTPPLPPFGYVSPAEVADHAIAEAAGLFADVFGADLGAAVVSRGTSKADAACQDVVSEDAERTLAALFRLGGKAKARGLAGDRTLPPAPDAGSLGQGILADLTGDASGKLTRAAEKLRKHAGKKCGAAALGTLFPGTCAAAADAEALAGCIDARARCRFCRGLATFDELPLDCDAFDDGSANASCAVFALPFAPAFVSSTPGEGESGFVPTRWLELAFAADFPAERLEDFTLTCDGVERAVRAVADGSTVFAIPVGALPDGAACEIRGPTGERLVGFATGAAGPVALYDRTDTSLIGPFPDDAILEDDPSTGTGKRIALVPPTLPGLLGLVAQGISVALTRWDGFSPLQLFTVSLSDAIDPATIPLDEVASLQLDAPVALLDVDPASPGYGTRVPFTAQVRSDPAVGGETDHSLILWPALDLRADGHYALVLTRGVLTPGGAPFGPSGFFERVLAPSGGPAEVEHARAALAPTLDALAGFSPAILAEDLALAIAVTTRSVFSDPSDWISVKEQILASAPPVLDVTSTDTSSAAQVVYRGTVTLPLWLEDLSFVQVTRDVGGAPVSVTTDDVPFVFRVPIGATEPMPIVIYQHGNPGSPDEVLSGRQTFLLDAGYAVLGIQDFQNRQFGEDIANQTTQIIGRLAFQNGQALTNFQTHADMMGILRAIQGMGVAENFPEIDPTRILFKGISFGAHDSLGFLPFAPEILAAASYVGSGRLYHANLHQIDYSNLLEGILDTLPGARPRDIIAGFAALQNEQDRDDPHLLARYLYREPLAIEGLSDTTPPSLLWIEGIGDSLVPNVATRATAVELGIPTVRPVAVASPVLTEVDAPLAGNLAPGVTAAHAQYDPASTPSCLGFGETEGHFCAQRSTEAEAQVEHLFETALEGAAEIIQTLP